MSEVRQQEEVDFPEKLRGSRWRNGIGFVVWGLSFGNAFAHTVDVNWWMVLLGSVVVAPFHLRRGEPGLLIPGTFLQWLGVWGMGVWGKNPAVFGLGLGMALQSAVPLAVYLGPAKGPWWGLRALLFLPAMWGGMVLPPGVAKWGYGILTLMSLETWRFGLRWLVFAVLKALYRFRHIGGENVPAQGAAVVVSNHGSLLDGWLLGAHTQRMARFLVYDAYYKNPVSAFALNLFRTIPISQGAKRDVVESLKSARRVIEAGHMAGIFPEGSVTRSGWLNPFQKGITRIVEGANLVIVPTYMDGLWMNAFSFSEAGFQLKLPRLHDAVVVEYGKPVPSSVKPGQLWNAVKALEVNAAFRRGTTDPEKAAAYAARRVIWMKKGTRVRNRLGEESAAGRVLGYWMPKLFGAELSEAEDCDFEIQDADAPDYETRAKWVLLVERRVDAAFEEVAARFGERACPILEVPELAGIGAITSPPVDFAGEKQGGRREGYVGRLPFGVEARWTADATGEAYEVRSPQTGQAGWVKVELPEVEDFGWVGREKAGGLVD
ncbi:MAG: 1-acyl-sn-glycerol-3-phosphate acyltransferase [Bryobacter sp.]|nr:1-acyl-sn-glycerol-3-phosphate acyltransferase [Bryobacter sp.]